MEIHAHAKINLFLRICGIRPDGYHELETLMCPIGLHDIVRLYFNAKNETDISLDGRYLEDVPAGKDNLAVIAAERFFEAAGIRGGVHIKLLKRIPPGAGLGGGSADAAAVLCGLNSHYDNYLPESRLMEIAAGIGADIPFFISGKPAIATGIGEKLSFFPGLPFAHVVLVYPGVPVSTARVYKNLKIKLTKNKISVKNFNFDLSGSKGIFPPYGGKWLYNDLESAAVEICPAVLNAKKKILSFNPDGASMTGSGSAVFGLFKDENAAVRAAESIRKIEKWSVFLTRLLV